MPSLKIEKFVSKLALQNLDPLVATNIYSPDNAHNIVRADNLKRYLQFFEANPPKLLLVGEAPGYKGCRVSGIPLTSTGVMKETGFFQDLGMTQFEHIEHEATSTIAWRYFATMNSYPLLWNIFPFHPHARGNDHSNRKPNRQELEIGKDFLLELLGIFPNVTVVSVGKVAHDALNVLGIPTTYVRHPSYGGQGEFIDGLEKISME